MTYAPLALIIAERTSTIAVTPASLCSDAPSIGFLKRSQQLRRGGDQAGVGVRLGHERVVTISGAVGAPGQPCDLLRTDTVVSSGAEVALSDERSLKILLENFPRPRSVLRHLSSPSPLG